MGNQGGRWEQKKKPQRPGQQRMRSRSLRRRDGLFHFYFKSETRRSVNFDEHSEEKSREGKSREGARFRTSFEMTDLRRRCFALCIMLRLIWEWNYSCLSSG